MPATDSILLIGTPAERRGQLAASITAGVVISAAIFVGLARLQHQHVGPLRPIVSDLESMVLPVQPPPPPTDTEEQTPVFATASIQLAASPSPDSPVKLPAAPVPSDVVPPVHAIPRFDLSPGEVRPGAEVVLSDARHIFNRAEVDERPIAIYRQMPGVTGSQLKAMQSMRAVFLMVANIDGRVSNLTLVESTGNPEVDQACLNALREWRFKPAVKKGQKVRCWVQQNLLFKVSGGSPFEVH